MTNTIWAFKKAFAFIFDSYKCNTKSLKRWYVLYLYPAFEPRHDKTNKMIVRPAKTQSDQCLRCPHEESLCP